MKHLKKLSVVLMLTTLFSVTFTSCIDNEVSPVVEAIYASQADLIAAQAGVQDAEAALLLAQAEAQQAQAEYTLSLAANQDAYTAGVIATNAYEAATRAEALRLLVATTNKNVADAQNAMALAEITFQAAMATAINAMENAGATVAVNYATQYAAHMATAAGYKATKLTKEGDLALAELYLKAGSSPETTWALYLAGLNSTLSAEQAKVTAAEAAIVALNTAKANPTARETQIAGLNAQKTTLTARKAELVALIAVAEKNIVDATAAKNAATSFMADPAGPYAQAKASLNTWKAAYTVDTTAVTLQSGNVTTYTAAIANYAGTTTTLTAAKNAAVAAVGQSATTPYTGLKGSIKTIENTLGNGGVAFTSPSWSDPVKTGAIALTEYGKLYNAERALAIYEHDFSLLIATYNAAAIDLAAKQLAYDGSTYAADLATANTNYTTAQTAKATAQSAYATAKTAFELNPTGKAYTDGAVGAVTDLGNLGIKTDASLITYMRVATWVETSLGSGLYVPATFASTKYNLTDLALQVTAIKTDAATSAVNDITTDAQIILWQQSGNYTDAAGLNPGSATSLSGTEAAKTVVTITDPTITKAYFVEVESDDSEVSYLATFNIATNKLGTNSFSSRPFTTLGATPNGSNWTAALTATDLDAGYLSTWNGLGIMGTANTLTAQAALWNMALELAKKQYAFDTGDDALVAAQELYDYQQELFEDGLAVIVTLENAVTAIETVIGKVTTGTPASGLLGQWEALNKQLGTVEFATPAWNAVKKTTAGISGEDYYMVGSVKTLTAYAVKWNAELALALHAHTLVSDYQTMLTNAQGLLTTATREAAEDLIYIAKYTADLAALQARYDALILTPLYAALEVAIVNATQAKAALVAEDNAATTSISSLTTVISALATTVPDYTTLIGAENGKITTAKAAILATQIAISKGGISVAGLQAAVADLKAQIALLTTQIANSEALAAKYKALMQAALSDS